MENSAHHLWGSMGEALNAFFSPVPGFQAQQLPSAWMISTNEPVVDFNCSVIDSGPEASALLARFHASFKKRPVPFMICLADTVDPSVTAQARELGLREGASVPMMAFRPDKLEAVLEPSELVVERVTSAPSLEMVADLTSTIFSLPRGPIGRVFAPTLLEDERVAVYLALLSGRPAGAVVLSLHRDRVGIWCMGTSPAFRRQGIGHALLMDAMRKHWRTGVTYFLVSTPSGRPLYDKVGFKLAATGQGWLGP